MLFAVGAEEFVLDRLPAGRECRFDLALKGVRFVLQQPAIGFVFDLAGGAETSIIGLSDLLGQPHVDFQRHALLFLQFSQSYGWVVRFVIDWHCGN